MTKEPVCNVCTLHTNFSVKLGLCFVFGHSQGFGSLYNYDSGCLPKISCDFTCVHHESKRYRVEVEIFKLIFLHVQDYWLVGVLNAVFICNSLENQMSKTWWSLDSVREYNVKSFS